MTSGDAVSILPALNAEQAQHSASVLQALRAAIAAHSGWLTFEQYLQIVLYAPGLGYYSAGSAKFGAGGDFVTAPELSDLFGRCIARQCAQVLQCCGGSVLELGAGSGALAASVLLQLQQLQTLPQHYYILEVSADLRERQRARLQRLPQALRTRVEWLEALPAQPMTGVILANEVADALPFRRFVVAGDALLERGVALSADGGLIEADRPASTALVTEVGRMAAGLHWPPGYQSECCPMLSPWIAALAAALACGAAFIVDYGLGRHDYYHPQRRRGTLRCHFRHRAHEDPLLYPGLQDISAWVDFTRVAEAGDEAQLQIAGYCTQAAFLLANDIELEIAAATTTLQRARLASDARQLLLPDEMGEHFKVMALTRNIELPLRGFSHQDLRRLL